MAELAVQVDVFSVMCTLCEKLCKKGRSHVFVQVPYSCTVVLPY
jgi:hypothetical protein